ncbi:hypothetical protein LPU83_0197 [Rhizobium favelukesii]|uniref:Uncharacterized protein n=1 Tax=Rhizobium favelukesii TaxID=348824 RepID=W6RNN4_9HYPH|nr:hypothetical protein LPU83_0197 [Rhizobium favelukesii]
MLAKPRPTRSIPTQTCRGSLRRGYDKIFRTGGLPTLVYVCDRDGLESTGTQVPLRGHYQPVR